MEARISNMAKYQGSCKRTILRLWLIPLLFLVSLAIKGPELLDLVWRNAGLVALAQTLVATPGEEEPLTAVRAETRLRRAVTYVPEDHAAWRGLGFALAAQGRGDEAVTAWQTAGQMAEEFFQRGEQAHRLSRYEEALVWYTRAAAVAPDWWVPWYYAGLTYENLEKWDDALESFRQAEIRPDGKEDITGSLNYHIGRILQKYVEPPDLSTALNLYEAALTSDGFIQDWERVGTHYQRGNILRQQGRSQEAMQEFKWVISADPKHYWGHVWLGVVIWRDDGDFDKAEKYLKQAIALNPEEKMAHRWLGKIYQESGRLTDAADAFQQVLEIDPADEIARQFFSKHASEHSSLDHTPSQ
jgi:tetratricopeptide (TPR) repeat protein